MLTVEHSQSGATVSAAYFGKQTQNQVSPNGNGTVAPKQTGSLATGAGSHLSGNWILVSALVGSTSFALTLL
jgi:hypothetical protein